jgi:hypothetical protein
LRRGFHSVMLVISDHQRGRAGSRSLDHGME